MEIIKKYRWLVFFTLILVVMFIYNKNTGQKALDLTLNNLKTMLSILPPIFIFIGLLDVWVSKETMVKYMGENSGIKGIAIALFLGSFAAGPLYAAFPIAQILIKKGARYAYILFFLGAWTSSKLPLMIYEYTSFGGKFTFYHVVSSLSIYLVGAFMIEKILPKNDLESIYNKTQFVK